MDRLIDRQASQGLHPQSPIITIHSFIEQAVWAMHATAGARPLHTLNHRPRKVGKDQGQNRLVAMTSRLSCPSSSSTSPPLQALFVAARRGLAYLALPLLPGPVHHHGDSQGQKGAANRRCGDAAAIVSVESRFRPLCCNLASWPCRP